jgi:hypothetical protein
MSKRTSPSSFESALESTKHAKSESSVAISLPSKSPLTDSPNIETPCTVSTIIEFLDTDSDVNDVLAPPPSGDSDPKLEISTAETLSSRMSASAAIASDECKFPDKFVTVMTFLGRHYANYLLGGIDGDMSTYREQLASVDGNNDALEYFDDLFDNDYYDYDKVFDALGDDGTPEQRKTLLRAFLILDETTSCSVNLVFTYCQSDDWGCPRGKNNPLDEDELTKEFLSHAPVGHCAVEYTALLRSYLEDKGPSLRELFVA